MMLGHLLKIGGRNTCNLLESDGKVGARLKAETRRNGLNGQIAIVLWIVKTEAGLLDTRLIE